MDNKTALGPVIIPCCPDSVNYCQVRFLNAAQNHFPLLITIGPRLITSRLPYKDITSYVKVTNSYCNIIIAEASNPLNILLRKSMLFVGGEQITLAIATSTNGIQIVKVSDQIFSNKVYNEACLRFVNLSYGSRSFDLKTDSGDTVFTDIEYTEVTPYKKAIAGNYKFAVFEYVPYIAPRNINEPLLIFPIKVKGYEAITIYLLGATYMTPGLHPVNISNIN